MAFRANWMNSQSFCNSFGMDLVALESQHEKNYFTKSSENNIEYFDEFVHIGGVFTEKNFRWISSNKNLKFDLNLDPPGNGTENCLQLKKTNKTFSFARVQCFGSKLQQFVCQKIIINESNWINIFGR
jgi:hypothetical protein